MFTDSSEPTKLGKWFMARNPIIKTLLVIVSAAVIFLLAQQLASLILSLYAAARQMTIAQANQWLASSIWAQFWYVLLAEAFTVGLLVLALKLMGKKPSWAGFRWPKLSAFGWVVLAYPIYYALLMVSVVVVSIIFPGLNLNQKQHIGFTSVQGNGQLILTFISLVVLPPIAEEFLFRGWLFEGLRRAMPIWLAAILTSGLFAAAHLPEGGSKGLLYVGAIDTFCLSLVLVALKRKTKSLVPGMVLHGIKNLIAFSFLYLFVGK